MERIAIISDIHGNLEALKTVLKDIKKKNIKRIFCLGDIVGKGIHPKECIDLILENCEVVVRGNLEEFIYNDKDLNSVRKKAFRKQLGEEYINKIKKLPFCYELYISGSFIRLFHASPTGVFDRINNLATYKENIKAFYPSDKTISQKVADIVIFGDLHSQFMEKFYCKTLINCGSVGNPIDIIRDDNIDSDFMEITQASYLIIEGEINDREYSNSLSFTFVRVPYDIEKELNTEIEVIEKAQYENELRKGIYRDIKLLKEKYNI